MSVFLNVFYSKPNYENLHPLPDVKNLANRPEFAKKHFLRDPLHYAYYIHKTWFKKIVVGTNVLCETDILVLRKDKCLSVENILPLKFDQEVLKK